MNWNNPTAGSAIRVNAWTKGAVKFADLAKIDRGKRERFDRLSRFFHKRVLPKISYGLPILNAALAQMRMNERIGEALWAAGQIEY